MKELMQKRDRICFSAAISADALHSQYDVPHLISQARVRRASS